jgi:hypothetical protein
LERSEAGLDNNPITNPGGKAGPLAVGVIVIDVTAFLHFREDVYRRNSGKLRLLTILSRAPRSPDNNDNKVTNGKGQEIQEPIVIVVIDVIRSPLEEGMIFAR